MGDEVYSMVRFPEMGMEGAGAYAEFVSVPAAQVALKPMPASITPTLPAHSHVAPDRVAVPDRRRP